SGAAATSSTVFDQEQRRQEELNENVLQADGHENPFVVWKEMGKWMTEHVTVIRYNDKLRKCDEKMVELLERTRRINLSDRSRWPTRRSPSRGSSITCSSCLASSLRERSRATRAAARTTSPTSPSATTRTG